MKTTLTCLTAVATLAIGSDLMSQSGYYGHGGGGGRGGGFTGDLGSSQARLPPVPKWNPNDTVAPRLPGATGSAGHVAVPTAAPTTAQPGMNAGAPHPGAGAPMLGGLRGMQVEFRRDDETLHHFAVDWTFPTTPSAEQQPSWDAAISTIAGSDARPLLVRRHGHAVEHDQDVRVEALLGDEEIRVLTRFFHCVDLPDSTRNPQHPFSSLYDPAHPPLLFLTDAKGVENVGFSGLESRIAIRDAIYATIARCYQGDAQKVVHDIKRSIEDYDKLLPLQRQLAADLDDAIVADGPKSPRATKLQDRLDGVRKELDALRANEAAITAKLVLKPLEPAPRAAHAR